MSQENKEKLIITDAAAARIRAIADSARNERLRITLAGGGCAGFQASFSLDQEQSEDDLIFSADGADVIIDKAFFSFLKGTTVDFQDNLMGSYFFLDVPNASGTCSCGTSFSFEDSQ